jgi:hypothetical protein
MHSGQLLFSYMPSSILLSVILLKVVAQLGLTPLPKSIFWGHPRSLPHRMEHFVFLTEIELGLTRILVSKRTSLFTPEYTLRYITLAVDS